MAAHSRGLPRETSTAFPYRSWRRKTQLNNSQGSSSHRYNQQMLSPTGDIDRIDNTDSVTPAPAPASTTPAAKPLTILCDCCPTTVNLKHPLCYAEVIT